MNNADRSDNSFHHFLFKITLENRNARTRLNLDLFIKKSLYDEEN